MTDLFQYKLVKDLVSSVAHPLHCQLTVPSVNSFHSFSIIFILNDQSRRCNYIVREHVSHSGLLSTIGFCVDTKSALQREQQQLFAAQTRTHLHVIHGTWYHFWKRRCVWRSEQHVKRTGKIVPSVNRRPIRHGFRNSPIAIWYSVNWTC